MQICFLQQKKAFTSPMPDFITSYFEYAQYAAQWQSNKNRSMHFYDSECNKVQIQFNFKDLIDACIQNNYKQLKI